MVNKKALFIILDGLGDHVIKDLGNKTPLEAAEKPNIDKIARYSDCGLVNILSEGEIPGSDTGHLSLFGYDLSLYPGRGVLEALGSEIKLNLNLKIEEGDIAFRINFSTVLNNIVIDRRIGRNDYGLDIILNDFRNKLEELEREYNVKINILHTVEHRGVLIIKGLEGYNVTSNDLHMDSYLIPKIMALDKKSEITAELLNKLIEEFNKFSNEHYVNKERKEKNLPLVNYLLLRGASIYKELERDKKFEKKYGLKALFIAGGALYLGVARYFGMDALKPIGATATVETSLFSKAEAVLKNKDKYDIIFSHIKATDSLSHDKNPKEKKKFIERIDRDFFAKVKEDFDVIILTGDHSTSSILGRHVSDPVPIMIYSDNNRWGLVKKFGERSCRKGSLGFLNGKNVMKIILDKLDKGIIVGE
ncbi:MAG: alkaline phosphatase family protein [Nanopusillaceae archaeon]